jgi:hypothetical protein
VEKDFKIMRNYNQIFENELVLRHIQGMQLPFAVRLRSLLFWIITLLLMIFIKNVPPFSWLWGIPIINLFDNFIILYGVIPVAVSYVLSNQQFNGKKPIHFFLDQLQYMSNVKTYAGFEPVQKQQVLVNHAIMFKTREERK